MKGGRRQRGGYQRDRQRVAEGRRVCNGGLLIHYCDSVGIVRAEEGKVGGCYFGRTVAQGDVEEQQEVGTVMDTPGINHT